MNGDGLDKLKQSTSSKTIALLINKFDSEPSTERNAASEKQKKTSNKMFNFKVQIVLPKAMSLNFKKFKNDDPPYTE